MKTLLRSTFAAKPEDDKELLLRNYQALKDSGLGFEVVEDTVIWQYIQDFATAHQHVPDFTTVRSHFEYLQETELVDRIETVSNLPPKTRGDFLRSLEGHVQERRTRQVIEILKDSSRIVQTGITIEEGKETRILRGPQDAIKYIMERGHDIVAPSTGVRLSGDATADGDSVQAEYDRVEADPLAGIGQFTGIAQIDNTIRGAKRGELWTHAAFTGGLKCVVGDTRIFDLATGRLRTAREIHESGDAPIVHALDERTWTMTTAQASLVVPNGVRPIFRLQTETGREIRVSGNHPFMLPEGWQNAEAIQAGDWVAVPAEMPWDGTSEFTNDEIALLGYLLGDGSVGAEISFTNGNFEILADFIKRVEALGYVESKVKYTTFPGYRKYFHNGSTMVRVSHSAGGLRQPWVSHLRVLLEDLGLWGCRATDKFVPGELWAITDEQVWLLLSALWSTDGRVGIDEPRKGRKPKATLWYGSRSERLVCDIQSLLQRVGVPSTVSKTMVSYKDHRRPFWTVLITTTDGKRRFLEDTRIVGKENDAAMVLTTLPAKKGTDWMPPILLANVGDEVRAKTRRGGWHYAKWAKRKTKIARDTFSRLVEASEDLDLIRKARGNVRWERVVSVDPDGEEMTYDLSVPGPANFVANGFITHNSTFLLNWSYNQAVYYRHSSIIFSLEMPYYQCRRILYAIHSAHEKFEPVRKHFGIDTCLDYSKIRDGNLDAYTDEEILVMDPARRKTLLKGRINPLRPEYRFFKEYVVPDFNDPKNEYGSIHIEVTDPDKSDFTVPDLRSRAELLYSKDPDIAMIGVDHAGLMAPRKWSSSTTERLNEVLRDLKRMSMNFNRGAGMAIIDLFQISREGFKAAEKADGRYNLTHLSYANECLVAGTPIPTDKGIKAIEDVQPGDRVWSRSGWKDVRERFSNGTRPIWRVETDRGAIIECTGNHLVRTLEGVKIVWHPVENLHPGDWLIGTRGTYPWPEHPPKLPPCGNPGVPERLTAELAYLIGAWDGEINEKDVAYTGDQIGVRDRILDTFEATFDLVEWSKPLKRWFKGVAGDRGLTIPDAILASPRPFVLAYLQGLFDTNGWINNLVGIKMKSYTFSARVQGVMSLLGYDTDISRIGTHLEATGWTLHVRGWESQAKFANEIGFTDLGRKARLVECLENPPKRERHDQTYPFVDFVAGFIRDLLPHSPTRTAGLRPALWDVMVHGVVTKDTIRYILDFMQDNGIDDPRTGVLRAFLDDLHVVRVRGVAPTGVEAEVFDIEVGGDHEYQTGPILSHNSERSSDIVTTTYVNDDLRKRSLALWQCLKTRDDEPFKAFYSSILWPCRLMRTCHDVTVEEAKAAGEKLDTSDLLKDM